MGLNGIPLFSVISGRMSWLSARQSVLAANVANADTPDYVARDVKPMEFERIIAAQNSGRNLLATNALHIGGLASRGNQFREENARGEGGQPMGNVVSIEQEMIKLSDTQIQYQTAANLYQKAVNMFRTALGARSG